MKGLPFIAQTSLQETPVVSAKNTFMWCLGGQRGTCGLQKSLIEIILKELFQRPFTYLKYLGITISGLSVPTKRHSECGTGGALQNRCS